VRVKGVHSGERGKTVLLFVRWVWRRGEGRKGGEIALDLRAIPALEAEEGVFAVFKKN
jgi:hypothetical protein